MRTRCHCEEETLLRWSRFHCHLAADFTMTSETESQTPHNQSAHVYQVSPLLWPHPGTLYSRCQLTQYLPCLFSDGGADGSGTQHDVWGAGGCRQREGPGRVQPRWDLPDTAHPWVLLPPLLSKNTPWSDDHIQTNSAKLNGSISCLRGCFFNYASSNSSSARWN